MRELESPPVLKSRWCPARRAQSVGEEIANSASHGVGLLVALVATPFLLNAIARRGNPVVLVGTAVFALTVILLYTASTLYHALAPRTPWKRFFRLLDHGAIFLLIAGTYTPLTLGVLWGPWGWTILSVVWTLAIVGVYLTGFPRLMRGYRREFTERNLPPPTRGNDLANENQALQMFEPVHYPKLSMALYLLMGWLVLIAIAPLWDRLPPAGWGWLAAGGISYTFGITFAVFDRLRYGHFVWHLFVLVGTVCHGVMVWLYAGGTPP
jgi:hemolysin III